MLSGNHGCSLKQDFFTTIHHDASVRNGQWWEARESAFAATRVLAKCRNERAIFVTEFLHSKNQQIPRGVGGSWWDGRGVVALLLVSSASSSTTSKYYQLMDQ
jgi:hypothetical protein